MKALVWSWVIAALIVAAAAVYWDENLSRFLSKKSDGVYYGLIALYFAVISYVAVFILQPIIYDNMVIVYMNPAEASYRVAQNTLEPKNVDTVVYSVMVGLLAGVALRKLFSTVAANKQAVVATQ